MPSLNREDRVLAYTEENNVVMVTFEEIYEGEKFQLEDGTPVIKLDEYTYSVPRFDGIQSIDNSYECDVDIQEIRKLVNKNFDYDLKYGAERAALVKELVAQVDFIPDLMSTTRIIQKEQKKSTSPLAENSALDKTYDSIADYILFTKYDDQQHELNEENKSLENPVYGKQTYDKEYKFLKDFSKDTRQILTDSMSTLEHQGVFASEEKKLILKRSNFNFKFDNGRFDEEYWERTVKGNPIPHYSESPTNINNDTYDSFKNGVDYMKSYLGLSGTKEEVQQREIEIKEILRKNGEGKNLPESFDVNRQYTLLRKTYSEYKGNFEIMKELLCKPVTLSPESGRAVIDIYSDTWYEKSDGEIVELSKNQLRMADVNLYKAILPLYADLKDKYEGKYTSDWYWLLFEIDRLIEKTEFTEEESQIIKLITTMKHTQQNVAEHLDLKQQYVSRLLSTSIPRKLRETYLDDMEEWVYTHKIKGTYKTCSTCGEVKLITNDRHFGTNKQSPDGKNASCRKCRSKSKS